MTSNQIKRILSGLDISTTKNEVLTIPYFRTIVCETRQGIDGESDQLKFDYSKDLLRIKNFYATEILLPLHPYEVTGREIKYISSSRRITPEDVIIIVDYANKTLTKVGNVVSNYNSVVTIDADFTFNANSQKMFFTKLSDYNNSVPSPRNKLVLLKYRPMSENTVDTYIDINSIVAIDTYNGSIDTSLV